MEPRGGGGARSAVRPVGGDRSALAFRDRYCNNRRQETIRGDERFRAGKGAGVWTDGDPTARECGESKENW